MSGNGNAAADNVVRLRPEKETGRASEKKWGKEVIALGFCIVPSLLLRAQNRLGLNPTQLAVLMQLCDFWWERDRKPYPGKAVLAVGSQCPSGAAPHRGPRNGRPRQTRRASGHPWRKADQHLRPRRAGGAAKEARAGIPRGGRSRQDGPQGGVQAGISPKPNRQCGQTVMIGAGIQTKTPGAYQVAEAGPGCTL